MTRNQPPASLTDLSNNALDAAFSEVLAAERAAEEAVAAARSEAEARRAAAETAARDLAERAATRARAWRERQAAALARDIAKLQERCAAAAEPAALDDAARRRLVLAVEQLADELCGSEGEAG